MSLDKTKTSLIIRLSLDIRKVAIMKILKQMQVSSLKRDRKLPIKLTKASHASVPAATADTSENLQWALVPYPERRNCKRLKCGRKRHLIKLMKLQKSAPLRNFLVIGKLGRGSQQTRNSYGSDKNYYL